MAYNNRPLSPGGRRIQNPGRSSDTRVNDASIDQYASERHGSYASPRTSTSGVIPISSETFVNYPSAQSSASSQQRYDSYSGRPVESYSGRARGPSYSDTARVPTSATTQQPSRAVPPKVVQADYVRANSPPKGSQAKEYYTTPAATKEPRKETTTRKLYAVSDGTASLVADVTGPSTSERHHKRKESNGLDRSAYKGPATENDRGRRGYHLNGPSRLKEKSIVDDNAYSYTDPASMFTETEPRWRARESRPRRNSIDRVGGGSRERPMSMLDPAMDPRRPNKDGGPPPSMRGWDKIKNVVSRSNSSRDRSRDVPQSPTRSKEPFSPLEARMPQSPTRGRYAEPSAYGNSMDTFYVEPRMTSIDRRYVAAGQDRQTDRHEQFEFREPRPQERRNSMTRVPDHSVERRGFGIRSDSRDPYARASDESFTRETNYRDSGYGMPEPQRHNTAPDLSYYDEQRLEQEKRDRIAERQRADERDRQRERETRDKEHRGSRDEEYRRFGRDDVQERSRRDRERDAEYDLDRQRERERERMMQPQPPPPSDRQPEREKPYQPRSNYRDYDLERKEPGPRDSGEQVSHSGLSSAAAIGGLGVAAAAAYGADSYVNKKDERERDRERDRDRQRDQGYVQDRLPEHNRERGSSRAQDLRPPQDNRSQGSHSDESAHYVGDRDHHRPTYNEPGLGFAFEEPSSQPNRPARDRPDPISSTRDLTAEQQDFERTHDDRPQGDILPLTADPDEDYRKRLEQVQRELGTRPEEWQSESDPDRERRRRERQRERELRNGDHSTVGTNSTYSDAPSTAIYSMPGTYDDDSVEGASTVTPSTVRPLRRRRSILDEPMTGEPAQIIDNSLSEKRENRVRIVDPPTEEDKQKPRGILKKPTEKFPEHPDEVREGVAPLKDDKKAGTKSGIPPGARWTKIDRRLVNPEALEDAKERFEERLDCVIVLRVLTKDEIQKLAYRTAEIREERYRDEQHHDSQSQASSHHQSRSGGGGGSGDHSDRHRRRGDRNRERRENDEYEDENSEDEFKPRAPKMLEAPAPSSSSAASALPSSAGAVAAALLNAVAGGAVGGGDDRDRDGQRDRDRERDRRRGDDREYGGRRD